MLLLSLPLQTADILQAVMGLALKKRLREYESVDTSVSCDAMGLLDGRFNSMCIEGRHWHTPLNMTAHKLEVGWCSYGPTAWVGLEVPVIALRMCAEGWQRVHQQIGWEHRPSACLFASIDRICRDRSSAPVP